MNLNKQQQQAYNRLSEALDVMTDVIDDPAVIREKMQPRIDRFVAETDGEIKVKLVGTGIPTIALIDLSKDSMKTTLDATQTLNLRARFESVMISVTAAYKDAYAHSNESIADALLGLSEKVRRLPFEVVAQGACNIDEKLGLSHSNADDGDDEDREGGGAVGSALVGLAGNATLSTVLPDDNGNSQSKSAAEAAEVGDAATEKTQPADAVIELVALSLDAESEV
jgi:hypothetical protein